jgi:murein L,D-transpeptidase YafK
MVPRYLLQLPPDQKTAVVVDAKRSRLYVYENVDGRPRFLADYYITQGKLGADKWREGDQKTPIGVYHITGRLSRRGLADYYGAGALPINYPNEWDRLNGRTGHGIWLHGTPSDTYSRPPRASDGCVVLANQDWRSLEHTVQIGSTPVIISENIEWLKFDDWNAERTNLQRAIEGWRTDWESRDVTRYLSHYSKRFSSDSEALRQWSERKRQVNAGKEWIAVSLRNTSMLRYPGPDEMVVVTFDQSYRSNNMSTSLKKRQYWVREDGAWKILYEGAA